jgi:putative ABC transport system permease protein
VRVVTPKYFQTVGTPLLRGRDFAESDRANTPLVAIIDESIARRYWTDGDALGKRIRSGGSQSPWRTIVGVVRSVRHQDLERPVDHYVYLPSGQNLHWSMDIVLRTERDAAAVTPLLRREVRALDPQLALYDIHTMEHAVSASLETRRLTNALLIAFAGTALLLAMIGIYGVMALNVASRTSEFGVRLALGSAPGGVRALVVRQGMALVAIGIVTGLIGAFFVTRFLRTLLVGVAPVDVASFALVTLILAGTALVACYLPARRATSTDPVQALRMD